MKHTYILYNPLAGTGDVMTEKLKQIREDMTGRACTCIDVTTLHSYADFMECVLPEDDVYLCGGDGTLNRFVNGIRELQTACHLYYCSGGTGNDFLRDLEWKNADQPVCINDYLTDLPTVTVENETYRFLNNVGFGIDGYCTETGDRMKTQSSKPVNYTSVAIHGLLFHFRPTSATVTVDGKKYFYRKVWLAPTMKGRFYGGGMMPTPDQNRQDPDGKVSVMVFHGCGKLRTLAIFPSIFQGKHIWHRRHVAIHSGHSITVEFEEPRTLQIDGETIGGVRRYHVESGKAETVCDSFVSGEQQSAPDIIHQI